MDLLLHPITKKQVEDFLTTYTQSIIIEGSEGAGKPTLANYLSAELLGIKQNKLKTYPYYLFLRPTDNTISIDNVRSCTQFMRLKTLGKNKIRRVLILENSQFMTIEAQNAFLKLFEEPPLDTVIILTVTNTQKLLPTIQSRAQVITIRTPSYANTVKYFTKQKYNNTQIQKAYSITNGRIGLMSAIFSNNNDHPFLNKINEAKAILQDHRIDKLMRVNELSKNKDDIQLMLMALTLVCRAGLLNASSKNSFIDIKRWLYSLKTITKTDSALTHNPNMKLLVTNLLLNV